LVGPKKNCKQRRNCTLQSGICQNWRVEKGTSKIIRNASELREQADYEDFYEATQEEAPDVFMQASQFILEVECYLHSKSIL
jgi:hypothetical protein